MALKPAEGSGDYDDMGGTTSAEAEAGITCLERHKWKYIEWPPDRIGPRFYRPEDGHSAPFRDYVQKHYHSIPEFDSSADAPQEIWERNPE